MNTTTFTTSWFGYEPGDHSSYHRICFRTEDNPNYFTFTEQYNYLTASVDMKPPFSNRTDPVASTLHIVFSSDRTELESSVLMTAARLNFTQNASDVEIVMDQISEAVSTKSSPCTSNAITNLDLRGLCTTKYFEESCGCYPFSWLWNGVLTNKNNLPFCGFAEENTTALTFFAPELQRCSQRLSSDDAQNKLQKCYAQNKPDCSTNKMRFSVIRADNATSQSIRLRMNAFRYMKIEQHLYLSTTDFIANVGGIIGVYNGAIGITYIHLLVFAVKWIVSCLTRKHLHCTTQKRSNYVANDATAAASESKTKSAIQEFAETTAFGGVLYAYRGSKSERICWCLIIGLFCALTIQNVLAQLEQYSAENTLTSINIKKSNSSILPSPTICLNVHSFNLWSAVVFMRDRTSSDVTNDTYVTSILMPSTLTSIKKKVEDMTIQLTSKDKAFILLATCMLFDMAAMETVTTPYEGKAIRSACCDASTSISDCNALTQSVSKVSNFLAQEKKSLVSLRQNLNELWVRLSKLKIQGADSDRLVYVKTSDTTTTWFGPEPCSDDRTNATVWYRMCFTYKANDSLLIFYENNDYWFWASYDQTASRIGPLGSNVLPRLSFVFSNVRAACTSMKESTVMVNEDNVVNSDSFYVSVEQHFTFLNLRRNPCMSSRSNFDCKLNCIGQSIIEQCRCMPFSLFWTGVRTDYNANSLPFCNYPQNTSMKCMASASVELRAKVSQCQYSCARDCTLTTVSNQLDPEGGRRAKFIAIKVAWFQRIDFKEEFSMSTEELWSNIGGILGVWTGACVLSYVHAVSFAWKMLLLKWRQRGRSEARIMMAATPHIHSGSPILAEAIYFIK